MTNLTSPTEELVLESVGGNPFSMTGNSGPKRTSVLTDQGARYFHLPVDDFRTLYELYKSLIPFPAQESKTPIQFVFNVDWRTYTEWCMDANGGLKKDAEGRYCVNYCYDYEGQGLTDFVRNETHLELVRKGFQWNKEENRFNGLNQEQYQDAKRRVMGAVVLRAANLFLDWQGNTYPPHRVETSGQRKEYVYDDRRNLRENLEKHIAEFDSLSSSNKCLISEK